MKKTVFILSILVITLFCGCSHTTTEQISTTTPTTENINVVIEETTVETIEETTEPPTEEETEAEEVFDTSSESNDIPDPNTTEMVDYLSLKAKEDAKTATDEDIQEAVNWLKDNTTNYFSGNENMEKTMYYGELLEYKYEDTDNKYEKAGWQAFKTVKYVYRGLDSVLDDVTHNNLLKLKELVEDL